MTKQCLECKVEVHEDEDEQGRNLNEDGTFHICKSSLVEQALKAISERSFSGRHPELGRMVNCQICGLRHRQNERKCEQKFATETKQGEPLQGELVPPEGLTQLTKKQVYGAKLFAKRRTRPHQRPKNPIRYWVRVLLEAKKKKEQNESNS